MQHVVHDPAVGLAELGLHLLAVRAPEDREPAPAPCCGGRAYICAMCHPTPLWTVKVTRQREHRAVAESLRNYTPEPLYGQNKPDPKQNKTILNHHDNSEGVPTINAS